MPHAFIDSASIHSALAALLLGKSASASRWDKKLLLNTTYLFLQNNVRVIPGLSRGFRGPAGYYASVVNAFPALETRIAQQERARQEYVQWVLTNPQTLRDGWHRLQSLPEYPEWVNYQRQLFWGAHCLMYGSMFDEEFIPTMAIILNCPVAELSSLHQRSTEVALVKRWSTADSLTSDAELLQKSWIIGALIRGKFHEQLSKTARLQLSPHPFRKVVADRLETGIEQTVYNTEELFCKILIASALRETTEKRRVDTWLHNLKLARAGIEGQRVALQQAKTQEGAENLAAIAAKEIGVCTTPQMVRSCLDWAVASGLGTLVALSISPWAGMAVPLIAPFIRGGYTYVTDSSMGADLAKMSLDTRRRFRQLALSVPGRIDIRTQR